MPTLLNGEDGGGVRYWNTISGAEVSGFGNTFFVNHGAGCVIYCDGNNTKVYNDTVAPNVVINGAEGRDWLINDAVNVVVNGNAGEDDILNHANNVELYGGTGNDAMQNQGGSNVKIYGDEDNDWIYNSGIDALIEAGEGYDNVENYGAGTKIYGGKDDDYIYNAMEGSESTIDGGADNDTILNGGNDVKIFGGDGEDSIDNTGNDVTIDGGDNDDKIINSYGSNILINAGSGDKNLISVTGSSSKVTIEGGNVTGADLIYNGSDQAHIKGNKGYDLIENKGNHAYIYGGADDDLLTNYGNYAHIYGEGGEDYIYSDNATDMVIDGGANADDIYAYHDIRALVLGGAGNDRIFMNRVSVSDKEALLKDLGIDSFNAFLSLLKSNPKMKKIKYVPLTVGDWKDWLGEIGSSIIDAVADEKLLIPRMRMGNAVKIAAGAQPWIEAVSTIMTIWKYLDPSSLLQQLNNAESTVNGGKGNDIIFLDGFAPRVVSYSAGDGNDVIYYMATNQAAKERTGNLIPAEHVSTLQIESGTIDDVTVDNKDVILKIGTGSVKLVDAAGFKFKVREADGTLTTRIYGTNASDNLYMNEKDNAGIICGNSGDDTISNGYGTSYSSMFGDNTTINGGAGNDHINNYGKFVSISGGADDDTIILSNKGSSPTVNSGKGNDIIYADFVSNVLLEYTDGDGNDIVYGFGSDDTLKISALSYTLDRKGFDLIVNVGDGSINLKGCRLLGALGKVNIDGTPESDLVNVEFYDMQLDGDKLSLLKLNPDEVLDVSDAPNEIRIIDASKSQTSVKIIGNSSVNMFTGSNKADVFYTEPTSTNSSFDVANDMEIINEVSSNNLSSDSAENKNQIMTVCAGGGNDTIYGGEEKVKLYVYNAGDGNDVIHSFSATDTLSISGNSYSTQKSGSNIVVTVDKCKITLKGAAILKKTNIIFTKQDSTTLTYNNASASKVTLSSEILLADASTRTKAIAITGNKLANTILGGSSKDTLRGAGGNDSIVGNKGNDSLNGGSGNDTLVGGSGNDTFTGGKGNDLFVCTAGKDLITDYASGDKISLGAIIDNSTFNGSDAVLSFGKNTLTIKNAKGKELVLFDSVGTERTIIGGSLLLDNSSAAKVTIASDVEVVDSSFRTNAVRLVANKLNNTILGGSGKDSLYGGKGADYLVGNAGADKLYGQGGNDTLWGGKGNDTLTGGKGADVFIYNKGENKDVITDFADDDLLQIMGSFSAAFNPSANTIAFNVGSTANAITLKDYTATNFNVNGDLYIINGSKLVRK